MKNDNRSSPEMAPADVRDRPLHDEIARQARVLWEQYGKPAGRDEIIWLEAERQLLGVDFKVRKEGAGTVRAASFAQSTAPRNSR